MLKQLNPLGDTTPIRLSEATRTLAKQYLGGDFKATVRTIPLPKPPDDLDVNLAYARHLMDIVEQAPLELLPAERLVGAARYSEAPQHGTPGAPWPSVSHVTIDFQHAVRVGLRGLEADIDAARQARPEPVNFYRSLQLCIAAMRRWVARYVEALTANLADSEFYPAILEALKHVPEHPPRNFFEAVQSLWLFWEFQRLAGNWSGLGRVDELLGPYLGDTPPEEAREILAHFWIKGTEWCGLYGFSGGDAQVYQNVILGGVDADGNDLTNEVTYLILDIVEELHISDFPIAVRVGKHSPDRLIRRIAEVQSRGGGIVSIYNEDVILPALQKFGYPPEEARRFTTDGSWEVLIPGQTAFSYIPFDALQCLQQALFAPVEYGSFDALYQNYLRELAAKIEETNRGMPDAYLQPEFPTPLLSLLMPSCIASGRSYSMRGARYNVIAIHAGGLPDVANSLLAIRKLVYEDRKLSLAELRELLRKDFDDAEVFRQQLLHELPFYGNDEPAGDAMLVQVVEDYVKTAAPSREVSGILRPVGISTFGREVAYAPERRATAFGKHAHEYLASYLAPTPGTDRNGPGAGVQSFCKVDFTAIPNGCPLDLRFDAKLLNTPDGIDMLCGLLKSFISLGGDYLQIDSVSREMLIEARDNPERYPNLAVRISGWSARFATLTRDWQDMIINRTTQP